MGISSRSVLPAWFHPVSVWWNIPCPHHFLLVNRNRWDIPPCLEEIGISKHAIMISLLLGSYYGNLWDVMRGANFYPFCCCFSGKRKEENAPARRDIRARRVHVNRLLGYIHIAPFSFLSVFVDENAVLSHCFIFKWIRYEMIGIHTAPAKRCC